MFTLSSFPAKGGFVMIGSSGRRATSSFPGFYCMPIFGPFYDGKLGRSQEILRLDGVISDSEKDEIGDRNCMHRQFTGNAYVLPFHKNVVPSTIKSIAPIQTYEGTFKASSSWKTRTVQYTHMLLPGDFIDTTYSFGRADYAELTHESYGYYRVRASFKDGRAFYGFWQDTFDWTSSRWVHTESGYVIVNDLQFLTNAQVRSYGFKYKQPTSLTEFSKFDPADAKIRRSPVSLAIDYANDVRDTTGDFLNMFAFRRKTLLDNFYPDLIPWNKTELGDLCQRCIDQQDFVDTNSLEFLSELRDLAAIVPKMGKLRNPKTWASWYLWAQYGANLTVQDTKLLSRAIMDVKDDLESRPRYLTTYATSRYPERLHGVWPVLTTYHYKVVSDPYPRGVMGIINALMKWNVYPTFKNVWDCIPFSFVIDWAVDVSSMLARLDKYIEYQYYDIKGTAWSRKVEVSIPVSTLSGLQHAEGFLTEVSYVRVTGKTLRPPRIRIDSTEFHNYAELTALIAVKH